MPAHNPRAPVESTVSAPACTDQQMDPPDTVLGPQNINPSSDPDLSVSELDYGPWLLVSHRRGGFRGCGGGTHATHVHTGSAVVLKTRVSKSRGVPSHSARGGKSFVGIGCDSNPYASCPNPLSNTLISSSWNHSLLIPTVDYNIEINPYSIGNISHGPVMSPVAAHASTSNVQEPLY